MIFPSFFSRFSVKPFDVPIAEIKELVMSPNEGKTYSYPIFFHNRCCFFFFEDTFVFVIAKPPYRDMVLDLGFSGVERVSEFVVTLYKQYYKLKGEKLPIRFTQS
jgi:hypothetical protein